MPDRDMLQHRTADDLQAGIERAVEYLRREQKPDGHWVGELEGDTILESEYILLMHILEDHDTARFIKAAEFIRRKQLPDGGWAIYPGGSADLSASVKAYFALKLTGTDPKDSYMQKARNVILEMGGAGLCNSYTKFYLATLGQISWDQAPAVPPEIMLLPSWFYINLYALSSWSRTFVVPLSIIWSHKPVIHLSPDMGIPELFHQEHTNREQYPILTWKRFFVTIDKVIKLAEQRSILPWREKALRTAENWMQAHCDKSAGLGAIYPPMVYTLIAQKCLGYTEDHPAVKMARDELEKLAIENDSTLRYQPCKSPVWDTAIAVNALKHARMSPDSHELSLAVDWLVSKEVREKGDWSIRRPNIQPGGWYFEYANEFYPDIDDTAMVLLALDGLSGKCTNKDETVQRAIDWIMAMQGRDGGWASFDVDNNHKVLCSIPFADHNAMIDPSTSDITARVLEMLAAYGYDKSHPPIRRGIKFLLAEQERDGSWFGRWGVNYIYGTMQALRGLLAVGMPNDHPSILRGAEWLVQHQNHDGGWGECISTYEDPSRRGYGDSTATQTAWALMGLIPAGLGDGPHVKAGIDFLLRNQNSEGSWEEEQWTGTGFPKVFYLKYHLYRHSFPLWALGLYKACVEVDDSETGQQDTGRIAA